METDDQILASVVKSAFALFEQDKTSNPAPSLLLPARWRKGANTHFMLRRLCSDFTQATFRSRFSTCCFPT